MFLFNSILFCIFGFPRSGELQTSLDPKPTFSLETITSTLKHTHRLSDRCPTQEDKTKYPSGEAQDRSQLKDFTGVELVDLQWRT